MQNESAYTYRSSLILPAPHASFILPKSGAFVQGQSASAGQFGGQGIKPQQKHPVRQGESLAARVTPAIPAGLRFIRFIRFMKRMRYHLLRETNVAALPLILASAAAARRCRGRYAPIPTAR